MVIFFFSLTLLICYLEGDYNYSNFTTFLSVETLDFLTTFCIPIFGYGEANAFFPLGYTGVLRKVVGKSARDNREWYRPFALRGHVTSFS